MKKILLIGGGGHCKSCIDVIEQENKYSISGILDFPEKIGNKILNYSVIGSDKDFEKYIHTHEFLITFANTKLFALRNEIYTKIKAVGGTFAKIISPRAYISQHATIGEGSIIMADAFVNVSVNIGKNCIINSKALIEHDCQIEDNCHIAPASVLTGGTYVRRDTFVGANATVVNAPLLEENIFIKAHSLTF